MIKQEMIGIRARINEMENEKMNENKFWGYAMDVEEEF